MGADCLYASGPAGNIYHINRSQAIDLEKIVEFENNY
jgi:hypothetical protein